MRTTSSPPLRFVLATALTLSAFACGEVKRPDGGEGLLPVGAKAPDLEGRARGGKTLRLSAAADKVKVVYFYPKDGTPGCTKEACAFRDAYSRFEKANVVVFGVSRDSQESHDAFLAKHDLPFYLTADEAGTVVKAYGVGSTLGMPSRVTFVVGRDNKIKKVFPDVDPAIHADEVLAAAAE